MSRAPRLRPPRRLPRRDPSHSLAGLARQVQDALDEFGGRLVPATGVPMGGLAMAAVVHPPSLRPVAPDPGEPRVGSGTDVGDGHGDLRDDDPDDGAPDTAPGPVIDDDHVETWRLVELAQQGDGEAFGQLYDRYVDSVFRFIYYRVNDRPLAEDFTSETFVRALRRIRSISYQGRDIGAWFITIARNIVLDHVKSARHRLESTTGDVLESPEYTPSTESLVLDSITAEKLMDAVNQLGDEQRECVMLRFMQGLSVSETAAVLGKNDGAVKALQHRAVRKLADLVGDSLR